MHKNLSGLSKDELLLIAKKLRIPNLSQLKKSEIISLIQKKEKSKPQAKTSRPRAKRAPKSYESPLSIRVRLKSKAVRTEKSGFIHPHSEGVIHSSHEPERIEGAEHNLPYSYGKTKIVLLVRDPYWCFSYWDFSSETLRQIDGWFRELSGPRAILRVYDVTGRIFDGTNALGFFDMEINFDSRNWYLELGKPGRDFVVDIGIRDSHGRFYLIARSNTVRTPRDTPSDVIDEEWMSKEFELLYAVSGGFKTGLSSKELIEKVKKGALFRQWLSSGAMSSRSS